MSAGEPLGPRRGWQPDEDPDDPVASDDTPEAPSSPARRGTLPEDADGGSEGAGPDAGASPTANPFARPGSEAALEAAIAADALELSPDPGLGPDEVVSAWWQAHPSAAIQHDLLSEVCQGEVDLARMSVATGALRGLLTR